MKTGKELVLVAKKKGICQEWSDQMKTLDDKNRLLGMYVHGTDFCLSNDFPTNGYIRENLVGRMEEYRVRLDKSLNTVNDRRVIVLGRCTGRVEINNFGVSEIFVKHESNLIVIVKGNSLVVIDMSDDSELYVVALTGSKTHVNHYDSTLKTESSERVVIKAVEKYEKAY